MLIISIVVNELFENYMTTVTIMKDTQNRLRTSYYLMDYPDGFNNTKDYFSANSKYKHALSHAKAHLKKMGATKLIVINGRIEKEYNL